MWPDAVRRGQPLMRIDRKLIAERDYKLDTPVLVSNAACFSGVTHAGSTPDRGAHNAARPPPARSGRGDKTIETSLGLR